MGPDIELGIRLRGLVAGVRAKRLWDLRARGNHSQHAYLAHVLRTVPFFAPFRVDHATSSMLSQLPIVRRRDVSESPESFLSTRFAKGDLVEFRTSGTSGVPLRVWRDLASYYEFAYETFRIVFERLPRLAATVKSGREVAWIINDNPDRAAAVQIIPSLGFAVVRRLIVGAGAKRDREIVDAARGGAPPLLYGRPRSLLRFAELIADAPRARRPSFCPTAVLASGDNLHDRDRIDLERQFRAPVYNAYASQEAGFIAIECKLHEMHVIDSRGCVEVLSPDKTVPGWEGCGELVITNFENWGMSFVRYGTGDTGMLKKKECGCGRSGTIIEKLDGRESIYFVINNKRLNPSVLNEAFERLPIAQFQVRQIGESSLQVQWIPTAGIRDVTAIRGVIASSLQSTLGPVTLKICAVETIGKKGEKVQRYVSLKTKTN